MRLAVFYDIHGNLPALEAVLAEVDADRIITGGDVLPGPLWAECLELLWSQDLPVEIIPGNGENDILAVRRGETPSRVPEPVLPTLQHIADRLTDEQAERIEQWPAMLRFGPILFCHATPRSDGEIFTRETPADLLVPAFNETNAEVVFCGHTHMPFDRQIGTCRVINPGSVGMPFGERGAQWAVVDGEVELRLTKYNYEAASARLAAADYPGAEQLAAAMTHSPFSAEEKLAQLEARAQEYWAAAG